MKNLGLLKEYKKNQIFYKWGDIVGKEIEKHIISLNYCEKSAIERMKKSMKKGCGKDGSRPR